MAKITVVDSDQEVISSISKALIAEGHILNILGTSAALINSLEKKQPDMIIIGVQLDDGDGREFSKHLQNETIHKNIPVIITSPFYHTDQEIRSYCCDDLVSYPFEEGVIASSVETLLTKERSKVNKQVDIPL